MVFFVSTVFHKILPETLLFIRVKKRLIMLHLFPNEIGFSALQLLILIQISLFSFISNLCPLF